MYVFFCRKSLHFLPVSIGWLDILLSLIFGSVNYVNFDGHWLVIGFPLCMNNFYSICLSVWCSEGDEKKRKSLPLRLVIDLNGLAEQFNHQTHVCIHIYQNDF